MNRPYCSNAPADLAQATPASATSRLCSKDPQNNRTEL
jgi:hypothetical protein